MPDETTKSFEIEAEQTRRRLRETSALNRLDPGMSTHSRRFAAVLLAMWIGGILLIALAAPVPFKAADATLGNPPEAVVILQKAAPAPLIQEVLRYEAGESNRRLFRLWGFLQLGYATLVFLVLLFLSDSSMRTMGVSLALLVSAALMCFILIPRIEDLGRVLQLAGPNKGRYTQDFQMLHGAFTAFEGAVAVLGGILLVLLLRDRGSRRR